jgi:hypothetical protein
MTTKIGIFHAAYGTFMIIDLKLNSNIRPGLGAFTSPFVATYFSGTPHWSFHYLISAVMAVSNTLALILVFRFKRMDREHNHDSNLTCLMS